MTERKYPYDPEARVAHLEERVRVLTSAIDDALEAGNGDLPDHLARLRMLDRLRPALTGSVLPQPKEDP